MLFLPKKIKVGFQARTDTYSGLLAYLIYYDNTGKLRKEASWNNWCDQKIEAKEYDNQPLTGFVLNKKVGGCKSNWNYRQSYIRVFDPRGFEIEITLGNLLYILENTSSIKGKGLEGEFVYGWSGTELVLIPTSSPDYAELKSFSEKRFNNLLIMAKDLKIGATYLTKENEFVIYMGRFHYYDYWGNDDGKQYFFYRMTENKFYTKKSIPGFLIDTISEQPAQNYADLFSKLESDTSYSPLDKSKYVYTPCSYDDFCPSNPDTWIFYRVAKIYEQYYTVSIRKDRSNPDADLWRVRVENGSYYNRFSPPSLPPGQYRDESLPLSLEEIYSEMDFYHCEKYLANGKFYGRYSDVR